MSRLVFWKNGFMIRYFQLAVESLVRSSQYRLFIYHWQQ